MALKHLDFTCDGNAKQVTATVTPIQQLIIYNTTGNDAILVGDSDLSASSYGLSIAGGATSNTIGPFTAQAPVSLSEVYIRGTNNNVVHLLYITF